jgi:hypothetical protein
VIVANGHITGEAGIGSGGAVAPGAASWPGLLAAPTFALMALWNGLFDSQANMICTGMANASPLDGMTLMYGLMAASHAGPWLKMISRRPNGGPRSSGVGASRRQIHPRSLWGRRL